MDARQQLGGGFQVLVELGHLMHEAWGGCAAVAPVHRAVLDGVVDSEGGDRGHRPESEWVVDEPDRAQPNGRGGWDSKGQAVTSFTTAIRQVETYFRAARKQFRRSFLIEADVAVPSQLALASG